MGGGAHRLRSHGRAHHLLWSRAFSTISWQEDGVDDVDNSDAGDDVRRNDLRAGGFEGAGLDKDAAAGGGDDEVIPEEGGRGGCAILRLLQGREEAVRSERGDDDVVQQHLQVARRSGKCQDCNRHISSYHD